MAWQAWSFPAVSAIAACLPRRSSSRVRRFLGRLWADAGTMEQEYPFWIRLYEKANAPSGTAPIAGSPMISILMPVFRGREDHLCAAMQSVGDQTYSQWELCLVDCSSGDPAIGALLQEAGAADPRIRLVAGSAGSDIAVAAGAALAISGGLFVVWLHQDALLSPQALFHVAASIAAHPEVDIIYADDDQIDEAGRRSLPYFKPDWNPELMLGQNLVAGLGAFRRRLVDRVGGFQGAVDGSETYDLGLRAAEATAPDRILHIPRVLYHWREAGGKRPASQPALDRHASHHQSIVAAMLERCPGALAAVPAWGRVEYPVPQPAPAVTVIIPTRDHADMLGRTMAGLLERTDYAAMCVVIVDNGSSESAAVALLEKLKLNERVTALHRPGPFNYAAMNNEAVRGAAGELILLLNNDIDVIHPNWMREMVSHAIRPGIGAVGAKLFYPDGTIQHGGVTLGMCGVADHQFLNRPGDDEGYFGHLKLARHVSAVTGACLMVRRAAYLEVDGLNEADLPVAFNDVDFCLKLVERGYRNLWTPHARLYHLESASRGSDYDADKAARLKREVAYMFGRWGHRLGTDPYWNANLSLDANSAALAFPPRTGSRSI